MSRRAYPPSPVIGVGASVYWGNKVLLIKRGKPPLKNTWSLPGGRVKTGESLKQALVREIKEECNIEIEVGNLIDIFEYIEKDNCGGVRYHYIVFDFKAFYKRGELLPLSDVVDAAWVPLKDLSNYQLSDKVLEVIRKGLEIKEQED